MPKSEIDSLVNRIKPLLAGKDPGVQGAVLADLLSMWIAGHPDFIREEMLTQHVDAVRALVPVNEKIMFGPAGHPQSGPGS
jgi:hypothetical protein